MIHAIIVENIYILKQKKKKKAIYIQTHANISLIIL